MIDILLCVLVITYIFIVLKPLDKYKIDGLKTIMVNYMSAYVFEIFNPTKPTKFNQTIYEKCLDIVSCVGVLFVTIPNIITKTVQENRFSVTSVATK